MSFFKYGFKWTRNPTMEFNKSKLTSNSNYLLEYQKKRKQISFFKSFIKYKMELLETIILN